MYDCKENMRRERPWKPGFKCKSEIIKKNIQILTFFVPPKQFFLIFKIVPVIFKSLVSLHQFSANRTPMKK